MKASTIASHLQNLNVSDWPNANTGIRGALSEESNTVVSEQAAAGIKLFHVRHPSSKGLRKYNSEAFRNKDTKDPLNPLSLGNIPICDP